MSKRIHWLGWIYFLVSLGSGCGTPVDRPNIVLIMTDDQGYGDVGFHGNPRVRTPNLDRFADQSLEMTHFYVSPVCAPTRASLMTGRYNYRTGVVDTYLGRAMMRADEVTIAEALRSGGYRTGIFGKWHLGDNYPLRAMDQGFDESLVHRGGGIGQPADPPGNRYLDPVLLHNGKEFQGKGYCTDIFFEAARRFIEQNQSSPFFVYLPTNAPHTPLQVPDEYSAPYLRDGLDEDTARVYGMVTNIDDNVGRFLSFLEKTGLDEKTIVIFMTDNGPQQDRYRDGLHGLKASVYEGGIRVPFLVRWPGKVTAARKVETPAAHIDILPTLLEVVGVPLPEGRKIDGTSLLAVWEDAGVTLPERLLFFQSHRGDVPDLGRCCAVRGPRYKLVQARGWSPGPPPSDPSWELFDLVSDPGETKDVAKERPELVETMHQSYVGWFEDVSQDGYRPPRPVVGTEHENPVTLTRQDWRGPDANWSETGNGYWDITIATESDYEITLDFPALDSPGSARLQIGAESWAAEVPSGEVSATFTAAHLVPGDFRLWAMISKSGQRNRGAHYVHLRRVADATGSGASPPESR